MRKKGNSYDRRLIEAKVHQKNLAIDFTRKYDSSIAWILLFTDVDNVLGGLGPSRLDYLGK